MYVQCARVATARSKNDSTAAEEVGHGPSPRGSGLGEIGSLAVTPGEVIFVVVDGYALGEAGSYELIISGS